MPVDFMKYMQRMPAWKDVSTEDAKHVESKLPELILLGAKQSGLLCSDVLKALGPEWLMRWETQHLSRGAQAELIAARLNYTPDESSPLNRQGTLILTGKHSKQLRKEATEARIKKIQEQEAAKAEGAQRKAA